MGLGALIIQERMQLTDRETLESISENPYMQYFMGLPGFVMKQPFHHSMMKHFRKRLTDMLAELNEIVATAGAKETKDDDDVSGGKVTESHPADLFSRTVFPDKKCDLASRRGQSERNF